MMHESLHLQYLKDNGLQKKKLIERGKVFPQICSICGRSFSFILKQASTLNLFVAI
jgi:hypothetical protein